MTALAENLLYSQSNIQVQDEVSPVKITKRADGTYILDMGQKYGGMAQNK